MSRRAFNPLLVRRQATRPTTATLRPNSSPRSAGAAVGVPRFATAMARTEAPRLSQRGDRWETEAARAAEAVVRQPASPIRALPPRADSPPPAAARRPSAPASGPAASAPLPDVGQGQPLSPALRRRLEGALQVDLRAVRLHAGPEAQRAAQHFGARAFALGSHIYLGAGESPADPRLIAHEAAHTVQQSAAQNAAYAHGPPSRGAATSLSPAPSGMIQREEAASAPAEMGLLDRGFWGVVEELAPRWLFDLLIEIRDLGFRGFLKQRLNRALDSVFAGLQSRGGVMAQVGSVFQRLLARGAVIVNALLAGQCEPLFAAVREFREVLSQMAGDAWQAITEFLRPVGDYLSSVWQRFGAPVVDFLKEFAADTWTFISDLGKQLWDFTKPVRDFYGGAWEKIKELLGFGEGGDEDGSSGLVGWIKGQAGEVWDTIKEELKPVVEPIKKVAATITSFLPLTAILNLRDRVSEWLDKAMAMADNMEQPGDVAENQDLLRDIVLPGIKRAIASLREKLTTASTWAGDAIGGLVSDVTGFFGSLAANPLLSPLKGAIQWLGEEATALGNWATQKVSGVFVLADQALAGLDRWIEPVIKMLQKLLNSLGNLMSRLGDLVLGPLLLVPRCIRDPIKDFLIKEILGRIPIFKQIVERPDAWAKMQAVFRTIVVQIFRDGNLLGAAWTFFKSILEVFGLPPKLITDLIRNAAKAFKDILKDPIGFLINTVKAATKGLGQFIDNVWSHLLQGLVSWLFGQLKDVNITVPKSFSLGGIFDIVVQILGLTQEHVLKLIEKKKGPAVAKKVRQALAAGAFVLKWLKVLIDKGPAGLWEEIKQNLSDLWEMVIEKVKDFVLEKIVQKATQWLLGFLDVSGLTPAINTVIAVYNAIESFMQYLKEILEIVNSVFIGVADIARGAIAAAANFVEGAAVKALPVAIGFLANQLGLGKLGLKIKEVVGDIRTKVDGAIEKLIDAAGSVWDSIKETAQKGVEAIFNWWKARETATAEDGAEHAVYLEGEPGSTRVMVASSPMDVDRAIVLIDESSLSEPEKKRTLTNAREHKKTIDAAVKELNRLNQRLKTGATAGNKAADSDEISKENKRMRGAMRELVQLLAKAVFSGGGYDDLEDTSVSYAGSTKATTAQAEKLTAKRDLGSIPSVSPPGWSMIEKKGLTGKAPFYVRLHLINENFQGSGAAIGNLVPGSKQNNGDHLRTVENPLKDLVGPKPKDKTRKAQVWYRATVSYHPDGREKSWAADVRAAGVKAGDFAEAIDFQWGLYERKGKKQWSKNASPIGSFRLAPIPLPDL